MPFSQYYKSLKRSRVSVSVSVSVWRLIELSWTANKGKSLHNKIIWSVKGGKEEEKAAVMNCQKCKNGGSQIGVDDT